MAGFWDLVPNNGELVAVSKDQLFQDLVANSDQTSPIGWQVRDSFFSLIRTAILKYQPFGTNVTADQLLFYYVSDPTMDLGVVASAVALDTQNVKIPRYARFNYSLDPTLGTITQTGVVVFSRWPFYSTPQKDTAPSDLNLVNG